MMEAPSSSEISGLTRATRRNISEDAILYNQLYLCKPSYTHFKKAVADSLTATDLLLEKYLTVSFDKCSDIAG
jgi:hypothetical protein